MATDFRSQRIRTNALIASRSDAGNPSMIIYSGSGATNFNGGIADSLLLDGVGTDTFLFVSGTITDDTHMRRGNPKSAVTLFGGDVVVSGTLYAERQVVEVDEVATGSLLLSGALFVSRSISVGENISLDVGQHGGSQIGYVNFSNVSGDSGFGFRTNGGTMEFKNSGGAWAAFGSGGGTMSSFILAGDGGVNPQTIEDGNTASIVGGIGITTLSSATDTLTVSLDYLGSDNAILAAGSATPVNGDSIWFSDADDSTIKRSLVSDLPFLSNIIEDTTPELGGQLVTGDNKISYATGDNTSEIDFTYNGSSNFTAIASVKSIDMFLDSNGGDSGQKFRIFNNLQPASSFAAGTNTDTNSIFMVEEAGNVLAKGYVTASMGFSGSLTQLTDGSSYLIAGPNIEITTGSNGAVTIEGTSGGSMTSWTLTGDGGIFPQTISDGDQVGIIGGTGITTLSSATDTLTVTLDYLGSDNAILAAGAATPIPEDIIWFSDNDDSTIKKAAISDLPFTNNQGDITAVTAGIGLAGGGTSGGVTVSLDYSGTANFILSATDGVSSPITIDQTNDRILVSDATDNTVKYVAPSQLGGGSMNSFDIRGDSGGSTTISSGDTVDIAGGTAINTVNSSGTVTANLDLGELTTTTSNSNLTHFVALDGDAPGATQRLIPRANVNGWIFQAQDGTSGVATLDPDTITFKGEWGITTSVPSTDNIRFAATGSQIGQINHFSLTSGDRYSYITYPLGQTTSTYENYRNFAGDANLKLMRDVVDWSMVSTGDGTDVTHKPQACAKLTVSVDNEKVDGLIIEVVPPIRPSVGETPADQKFRLKMWYYVPGMQSADFTANSNKYVDLRICGRVLKTLPGPAVMQPNEVIWLHADQTANAVLSDNSTSLNGGWCDQNNAAIGQDTTPGWASWYAASGLDDINAVFKMNDASAKAHAYAHTLWSQEIKLGEIINSADIAKMSWDDRYQIAIARNRIQSGAQPLHAASAQAAVDDYPQDFYIIGIDVEWLTT